MHARRLELGLQLKQVSNRIAAYCKRQGWTWAAGKAMKPSAQKVSAWEHATARRPGRHHADMDPRVRATQPVTPVIETLRGLLLNTPVGTSPWRAPAWCTGILVTSVALFGVLFRRRTS